MSISYILSFSFGGMKKKIEILINVSVNVMDADMKFKSHAIASKETFTSSKTTIKLTEKVLKYVPR